MQKGLSITSKPRCLRTHPRLQGTEYTTGRDTDGVPTSRVLERMWEVLRRYMKVRFSDCAVEDRRLRTL